MLGLAGLVGSGRTEIAESIFGLRPAAGHVVLDGKPFDRRNPAASIDAGLIYLPEDRGHNGVFANVELARNITAAIVPALPHLGPLLRPAGEGELAAKAAKQTRVVAASLQAPIKSLSGGNQQRAMFSRWLLTEPKVAIFDEPTRGVDVGAKADIYEIIDAISDRGVAVVMISSELDELALICDRVIAIYEGRIVGEIEGDEITLQRLGTMIVGGRAGERRHRARRQLRARSARRPAALAQFARRREPLLVVVTLAVFVITTALQSAFGSGGNISFLLADAMPLAIVAVGQTVVMLVRGIDVSVAPIFGIAAVSTGFLAQDYGSSVALMLPLALAIGIGLGFVNGLFVAYARIPPIITTLGTFTVYGGIQELICNTRTVVTVPSSYVTLGNRNLVGDIPYMLIPGLLVTALWR